MMTFIVVLVALSIERFFDWSHIRHWSWYKKLTAKLLTRFQGHSPYVQLALCVIPIMLMVLLIQLVLQGWLYGFASLVFDIVILIYCLGPQNLWADSFACTNSIEQHDQQNVSAKLKHAFNINGGTRNLHHDLLQQIFISANCRVFAVVFWYLILGPVGAVMYRLLSFCARNKKLSVANRAAFLKSLLDWLPIRIVTFLFALGGHFSQVFSAWCKHAWHGVGENDLLLVECGTAALGYGDREIAEDGTAERNAISLLDRVLVIAVVVIVIVDLVV